MADVVSFQTAASVETCHRRLQRVKSGQRIEIPGGELVVREVKQDLEGPSATAFKVIALYDQSSRKRIPVYATLEARGVIKSAQQGAQVEYGIRSIDPKDRFERLFLLSWNALTLILPLVFLVRAIQTLSSTAFWEFGLILLLPIGNLYLLWSTAQKGKLALVTWIRQLFLEKPDPDAPLPDAGPDWVGALRRDPPGGLAADENIQRQD